MRPSNDRKEFGRRKLGVPDLVSVAECVICGASIASTKRGMVAPFLARRIWNRSAFPVRLAECGKCGFVFFASRLDQEEEKRLYAGYRKPEYQQMRQSLEPWYTVKFNYGLSGPEAWQLRKRCLEKALRDHLSPDRQVIGSVLDFGGDRGDLIAALVPNAKHYVYDISGVEPLPGIELLRSLDRCKQYHFDLVLTSNVLEHVGFPRDLMHQVAEIASPGTLVFNEVPYESATGVRTMAKRVAQAVILGVMLPRVAWSLLRPGGLNLMHEHVNFFSPQSLESLMQATGWKVLASGVYRQGDSVWSHQMAWSLAQVV